MKTNITHNQLTIRLSHAEPINQNSAILTFNMRPNFEPFKC